MSDDHAELLARLDERSSHQQTLLTQLNGDVRQMLDAMSTEVRSMSAELDKTDEKATAALTLATEHRRWFTAVVQTVVLAVVVALLATIGLNA